MKAIDTNVLVRIIILDDESQSKKALNYVKSNASVFISLLVLCEFSWVCFSCYELKKSEFLTILEKILQTEEFIIESSEEVWAALSEFKKSSTDFSDCLIGAIAKQNDCKWVGTFDKKAARSSYFELII